MRELSLPIVVSAAAILFFGSCAREEVKEPEAPIEKPREESGERAEGVTLTDMKEGEVLTLRARAVSGLDQQMVTIEEPRVEKIFYGDDGEKSIELEADTGVWNRDSGQIEAEKEVKGVVRFEEEIIIRHADRAYYEPKKHMITLDGRVKIERKGDILNADKITIYLDEGDREIIKVVAEGNVTGRIFPEK
ncbi:LPS export ABC transporter periplasmic protein LptC [candidate division NPL-UPA2 bacterium]|nr:LPS export ABC transporter periplasmic protein LptC [candidate division NPL-UPA2 bacterium]